MHVVQIRIQYVMGRVQAPASKLANVAIAGNRLDGNMYPFLSCKMTTFGGNALRTECDST